MQHPVIQVLDGKVTTRNRRQQIHLCRTVQIIPLALEPIMLLLLHHNDHIARLHARGLITLPVEAHLVARPGPFVDVHIQHLALLRRLFAVAGLAAVLGVHHLARALALVTRLLDLLHHGSDLAKHDFDTLAATRGTGGDGALFAAAALAAFADGRFGEGELLVLALVEVFEGDGDAVNEVLAATGSLGSAT